MVSFARLPELINGRDVYIWGAGYYGHSIAKKCLRNNIPVKGYIDSNKTLENSFLDNIKINTPESILNNNKIYVICAVNNNYWQIEKQLKARGYNPDLDYWTTMNILEFIVEIMGSCNLRCPSCPRGNSDGGGKGGVMDIITFEKIIDKIQNDEPETHCIPLFNWGEPFLHPQLADCIKFLKRRNIYTSLSSNMSIEKNFDDILRAEPEWLRVSMSGYYQDVYQTTHTGGSVDLVKSNLYRIKYMLDKYKLKTIIEINYHKYTNNTGDDLKKIHDLCVELGFQMHDVTALFVPIERIIDIHYHKTVKNLECLKPLYIDKTVYEIKKGVSSDAFCTLQKKQIPIDCNGKVLLCCAVFDRSNYIDADYLTTPIDVIISKKMSHDFCKRCKSFGLAAIIEEGVDNE